MHIYRILYLIILYFKDLGISGIYAVLFKLYHFFYLLFNLEESCSFYLKSNKEDLAKYIFF